MENFRFKALAIATKRKPKKVNYPEKKTSEYFGENTFNKAAMRKYLSEETFESLMRSIETNEKIDRKTSDHIANALKVWAISKGATHYTHWFQPLTGLTAEKHDAFLGFIKEDYPIETFQGEQLIQQEPDASSFPSGGIRNTFEARGYTAWDPTSPAFIIDRTLCIPTIFIAYTGEALDFKMPLLKALNLVENAALEICKIFDKKVTKVKATLGIEQEYFLVDSALFNARPDLMLTGRTLFGHAAAKDQQLEDNYFGTIPERVIAFMQELEIEAHKLGIPLKTRHNEVAPNQFECAPIFEEVNIAVDHNQLLMDIIEKIAKKHNFNALLHEKPFAGINGSGKHNNWSLMTNTGENLLSPGKDNKTNFRFLVFLAATTKAVFNYNELLRASIASANNDLRLGGHEAPPAIFSVFMGSHLSRIFNEIENSNSSNKLSNNVENNLFLNISKIPEILIDNTDRNRTSPFAFTGNKFEFRAVGSSSNSASAMTALNGIVAEELIEFKKQIDLLILQGTKKNDAIFQVLKQYIIDSKPIIFEGNNYSQQWLEEAQRRGLKNITSTPEALQVLLDEKTIRLFEKHQILSKRELFARYEVLQQNYIKKIQIEARVLGDLASNHIIPVAIKYQNRLIKNVKGIKDLFGDNADGMIKNRMHTISCICEHITSIRDMVNEMIEQRKIANTTEDTSEKAFKYLQNVFPFLEKIRTEIDKLELLIDDELYPMPKYRELLFIK